jgi:DNA-binding MarR family transcriptional regulator
MKGRTNPIERATRRMFTRIMTSLARTLQDEALTVGQIAAVFLVDDRGSARVADLTEALGLSPSATSRMVDALVTRGFLARVEDPDDRRARRLSLTPVGRAFVERLGEERVSVVQGVAGKLPAAVVERIISAIDRPDD